MFFINFIFHFLHIAIIVSSLTLFLFEGLVVSHLWLQATILSSWLIIGPIINKPGMCLLTEIQKKMGLGGDNNFPDSYMFYLSKKLGYKGNNTKRVDIITFSVFSVCTVTSILRYIY
jgi:hypothetical protein